MKLTKKIEKIPKKLSSMWLFQRSQTICHGLLYKNNFLCRVRKYLPHKSLIFCQMRIYLPKLIANKQTKKKYIEIVLIKNSFLFFYCFIITNENKNEI